MTAVSKIAPLASSQAGIRYSPRQPVVIQGMLDKMGNTLVGTLAMERRAAHSTDAWVAVSWIPIKKKSPGVRQ